jgi:molecular chaperone GrpE
MDDPDFVEKTDQEKLILLQDAVSSYQQTLLDLQEKNADLLAKLQRSQANYANYQKRAIKDQQIAVNDVNRKFLADLIPFLDNLEVTYVSCEASEMLDPLDMLLKQLSKILEDRDVARIQPSPGDTFNPELHQAISVQFQEALDKEIVGQVMRAGYLIGEQVFRPADVIVFKPK